MNQDRTEDRGGDLSGEGHRAVRELIGAYVLGQLEPAERARVRAHLESCASCRAEARKLSPLAASLRSVDPDRLGPAPEPPADLGERVVQSIRRDRRLVRRRRWVRRGAAALAVAASLVIAFTLGGVLRPTGPVLPPGEPLALTTSAGVSANAALVRHTWGTELRLEASGLRQGDPYAVRFVTDAGAEISAGSLIGTGAKPLTCSLNAALPLDDAKRVFVTDRSGTVVLDGEIS